MADIPNRIFRFGAIVHPDYMELALRLPALEDRLNGAIDSRSLGEAVDLVYFAPILMPEEDLAAVSYPEVRRWEPRARRVWIQTRLDAKAALELDDTELTRMVLHQIQRELNQLLADDWSVDLLAWLVGEEE